MSIFDNWFFKCTECGCSTKLCGGPEQHAIERMEDVIDAARDTLEARFAAEEPSEDPTPAEEDLYFEGALAGMTLGLTLAQEQLEAIARERAPSSGLLLALGHIERMVQALKAAEGAADFDDYEDEPLELCPCGDACCGCE